MNPDHWVVTFYLSVAVTFMAVFVWLAVRAINRRERWAKRSLAAMFSMPVLYLASWPAMDWLDSHGLVPDAMMSMIAIVYYPAGMTVNSDAAPGWMRDGMIWYLGLWGRDLPMTIILPTLGIAFAAFCVWLTVRTVNRRERWAKRTVVVLPILLLVGYLASIGPVAACLLGHEGMTDVFLSAYRPIIFCMGKSEVILNVVNWYLGIWTNGAVQIS